MKRLLPILCLFLSSTLWAAEPVQLSRLGVMMIGGGATAACTAYSASCTGTCVYSEDWEGAEDCGDASHTNCRYAYTETSTPDYNNANTTSQCSACATKDLKVTYVDTAVSAVYTISSSTTFYVSGYVKATALPSLALNNAVTVFSITATDTADVVRLYLVNRSSTILWGFGHRDGSNSIELAETNAVTAVQGTWYKFKMKFVANQDPGAKGTSVDFFIDATQYDNAGDYTTRNVAGLVVNYQAVTLAGAYEFDNVKIATDDYPACP